MPNESYTPPEGIAELVQGQNRLADAMQRATAFLDAVADMRQRLDRLAPSLERMADRYETLPPAMPAGSRPADDTPSESRPSAARAEGAFLGRSEREQSFDLLAGAMASVFDRRLATDRAARRFDAVRQGGSRSGSSDDSRQAELLTLVREQLALQHAALAMIERVLENQSNGEPHWAP